MKKELSKKELHRIAKTIQWHYKFGLASVYNRAFSLTKVARYHPDKLYDLRLAIEDCLTPSNKIHDKSKVKEVLNNLGVYHESEEYEYITFLAGFKLPTLKTITSDLRFLVDDFNGINFSSDKLSVEMGPFELEGIEFGNFIVTFPMKYFCVIGAEVIPIVQAVTPNFPPGDDEHTHPHVRGNEVCLGQGRKPLNSATAEGRLQDCFEIVRSVLNTYNDNDPFAHMIKWTGELCRNCHDYYDSEYGAVCNKCERQYCENCVRQCCSASEYVCYRCNPPRFACRYCGMNLCSECLKICEKCGLHLCSVHNKEGNHRCA